jgi:hypothetical protein
MDSDVETVDKGRVMEGSRVIQGAQWDKNANAFMTKLAFAGSQVRASTT